MNDDFEISDELREAIRDVAKRDRLEIPDDVDARLRAAARRPRGRLLGLRRAAVAAAAALVLGLGLWAVGGRGPNSGAPAVAEAGDLDGDGRIDIVDAYLLDRRLDAAPAAGDVDGDGRVDRADLRRLLEEVVSLGRKG